MKTKFFYMLVAEFKAEAPLTELPKVHFPQIIEKTLKTKQSLEVVNSQNIKAIRFCHDLRNNIVIEKNNL